MRFYFVAPQLQFHARLCRLNRPDVCVAATQYAIPMIFPLFLVLLMKRLCDQQCGVCPVAKQVPQLSSCALLRINSRLCKALSIAGVNLTAPAQNLTIVEPFMSELEQNMTEPFLTYIRVVKGLCIRVLVD
jgi:hypothetical protein